MKVTSKAIRLQIPYVTINRDLERPVPFSSPVEGALSTDEGPRLRFQCSYANIAIGITWNAGALISISRGGMLKASSN